MAEPALIPTLASALGVRDGDIVAFVGGGGKTSSMFRLADELAGRGALVLTSTTTRMAAHEAERAPRHVYSPSDVRQAFSESRHVLLTGETHDGKLLGVDSGTLCGLCPPATHILVEADGSRGLPFKAPADHEPVIPSCTTLVVPVVGIDALGKPLIAAHVHRPERISRLCSGDVVDLDTIAAVLSHPLGGCKNVPIGARIAPLVNKVDGHGERQLARELARRLLASGVFDRIVLGSAPSVTPWEVFVSAV